MSDLLVEYEDSPGIGVNSANFGMSGHRVEAARAGNRELSREGAPGVRTNTSRALSIRRGRKAAEVPTTSSIATACRSTRTAIRFLANGPRLIPWTAYGLITTGPNRKRSCAQSGQPRWPRTAHSVRSRTCVCSGSSHCNRRYDRDECALGARRHRLKGWSSSRRGLRTVAYVRRTGC